MGRSAAAAARKDALLSLRFQREETRKCFFFFIFSVKQKKRRGAKVSSLARLSTPPLLHALDSARKAPDAFRLAVLAVVFSADPCSCFCFCCCCRFDVDLLVVAEHRFYPVGDNIPRQE